MPDFERIRDRDLLKRFHAGDRDSFAEIYRVYHMPVFRFASLMAGDGVKAAEITQDVFVWLIHHPNDFDPQRGELGSFLIGVCRKLLKRRYSEEQRWVPLDESATAPVSSGNTGGGDVFHLRRAISALPERYRAVVVLCDLEEKTYEQAAAIVECAVGTVLSRLHRARALLTRKLVGKGCPA